jgi:pyruvate,water dikinase
VAREFRVPALFDVGSATTALAEGEVVTVDADGRRIARGRVEPLLAGAVRRGNIMQGSPVYETLDAVGRLIIPLSLLDPAAPEFRPESCRTLHDITRFVHEKSVQEMFGFGGDQDVTRGVAKQLVFKKRPMQWWIVDLGDAFREPAEGNRVAFENIDSPPMLAIWEGICAVPWAGPPAPSGKGMMSVFMEASMNPELSGSGQSSFESRSYFMVSRNYCCLNTRIGFHFTTIEALVGDDASENYVSFRYSGGAADEARRALRASFIAEILEGHGFLAAIKGDILSARIEQRGPDYMLARLKLLGYLLIHTRQIDMVMTDTATVRSLRAKIDTDLARLL